MAAKDWAGVTAGLALATFGLGAFVASGPAAAPETTVSPVESAAIVEAPTAGVVEAPAFVETMLAPQEVIEIQGLSDSTTRLLNARGYADRIPEQELGLSSAVVRVLERAGTVLLVPDESGS